MTAGPIYTKQELASAMREMCVRFDLLKLFQPRDTDTEDKEQ